ncbi:MAG TPA: pyridoxamine 5'-phosphate oxidase family protein [Nitriliruptorales bacterium]|nr:pyridoxamine 5'-phosphate oxidase family protein [Nitriliruptorales bacterium]
MSGIGQPLPAPGGRATWREFAAAAPRLAERIRERFAANRHHVLGTLRPSGAPRLSGTEVVIGDDQVVIGMMPGSRKLHDVRRDPRVELHSAPLEEDLAAGDAKLAGVLVPHEAEGTESVPGSYFRLDITIATLVRVEGDELVLTTWGAEHGVRTIRRR